MKFSYNKILITTCLILLIIASSCKKAFLQQNPLGALSENTLATKAGVKGLLVGAYSLLDGVGATQYPPWQSPVSNFLLGGVASDDAYRGSSYGDETYMEEIENYTSNPTTQSFDAKWQSLYAGIQRANDVIRVLAKVTDGSISAEEAKQIKAEAVFLRAVFHFEAAKVWRNIPYVDEGISFQKGNYNVSNKEPVWSKIETDFQFAADNLTSTNAFAGGANNWAAKAFLAKLYMFQYKYAAAQPLFNSIIANGNTANGQGYALMENFNDNFNAIKKNNAESVFSVQMSVNDNAGGNNGNAGDLLNYPQGGPGSCCIFYQPSFSLVNSFKTDPVSGLPLLNNWNDVNMKSDLGVESNAAFTPYSGTVDSRLDYTVGRRGIPYLDWGVMPGKIWVSSQEDGGPFVPIKNVFKKADKATTSESTSWAQVSSNNYTMIRFSDLLLLAAEAEIEVGSPAQAEIYVNRVRARAANTASWVKTYIDASDPSKGFTNIPAANYKVGLYSGQFTAMGQDYARKAVRYERKLELAMEGHRFFDLQRYDHGTGYMADVLNAYVQHDTHIPGFEILYMQGAKFTKGKNELYPIPQAQIDLSAQAGGAPTLIQNPGYH